MSIPSETIIVVVLALMVHCISSREATWIVVTKLEASLYTTDRVLRRSLLVRIPKGFLLLNLWCERLSGAGVLSGHVNLEGSSLGHTFASSPLQQTQ